MLRPSKKGQYALRALYELARRRDQGPTKISIIAETQKIPRRFLEVILHQMKGSGLVISKRGFYGGYTLARAPSQVTVGEVLRYLERDLDAARCIACVSRTSCPFFKDCAFSSLWEKVKAATFKIYDETTIQDLLDGNKPMTTTG